MFSHDDEASILPYHVNTSDDDIVPYPNWSMTPSRGIYTANRFESPDADLGTQMHLRIDPTPNYSNASTDPFSMTHDTSNMHAELGSPVYEVQSRHTLCRT